MKRRVFLGSAPAAALVSACSNGREHSIRKPGETTAHKSSETAFAGKTLENLLARYRYDLFDDFLPFMDEFVIDHEYGGFMCNTGRDGANITTNKAAGYEGRGIWVYSYLYNKIEHLPEFLEIARKSAGFLLKNEPAGDNMWPGTFAKDGTPLTPPDRRIYNDMFIATGFQEYAKATGETKWWNKAKNILLKCMRIYDRPDYYPEFARVSYYLGADAPLLTGPKCIGEWMVLYWAAVEMLDFKADPDIVEVAARCVDAVMNYHNNPEFGLFNELLEHDMSRPGNEISQLVYTGHGCQILWMFMYEAVKRNDAKLFEDSVRMFRRHAEVSLDDVYGGVFQCLQHVDTNVWLLDKPLWAQEEVLIGALYAYELTGEIWAHDLFTKMYSYVREKFVLKQYGFPLWILHGDRKVTFEPHASRIGNFHHPRHLLYNLLSIDRMTGGNI